MTNAILTYADRLLHRAARMNRRRNPRDTVQKQRAEVMQKIARELKELAYRQLREECGIGFRRESD